VVDLSERVIEVEGLTKRYDDSWFYADNRKTVAGLLLPQGIEADPDLWKSRGSSISLFLVYHVCFGVPITRCLDYELERTMKIV